MNYRYHIGVVIGFILGLVSISASIWVAVTPIPFEPWMRGGMAWCIGAGTMRFTSWFKYEYDSEEES